MTQLKILDDLENLKFYEKVKIRKNNFAAFLVIHMDTDVISLNDDNE